MPHLGVSVRAQRHDRDDPDHVEREVTDDELDGVRQLRQHEIARTGSPRPAKRAARSLERASSAA